MDKNRTGRISYLLDNKKAAQPFNRLTAALRHYLQIPSLRLSTPNSKMA